MAGKHSLLGTIIRTLLIVWFVAALPTKGCAQGPMFTTGGPATGMVTTFTNPITFTALATGYFGELGDGSIHLDGMDYPADVDSSYGTVTANIDIDLTKNPQQHDWYATVIVYDYWTGLPDYFLDTRDHAPNVQWPYGDAPFGDGWTAQFIHADIRIKRATWMNRGATQIHDSRASSQLGQSVDFPDALFPYHYCLSNDPNTQQQIQYGPFPAVYVMGTSPTLETEVYPLTGSAPTRENVSVDEIDDQSNYPFPPPNNAAAGQQQFAGNVASLVLPPLDAKVDSLQPRVAWTIDVQFHNAGWSVDPNPWLPAQYLGYCPVSAKMILYVPLSSPLDPQQNPYWIAEDEGCSWATGATTAAQAAEYTTGGLWNAGTFVYQGGPVWTTPGMVFNLTGLYNLYYGGLPASANCVDVSDYLCIVQHAIGVLSDVSPMTDQTGQFTSNLIQPIGLAGYRQVPWVFHQFTLFPQGGGNVYDACAAHYYDLGGADYEWVPVGWPIGPSGYWQTPNGFGLVRTPKPSVPVTGSNGLNLPTEYVPSVQ